MSSTPSSPTPSPTDIALAPTVRVAESALAWSFARAGGPGGQNVNKVNTKAELRVALGALRGLDEGARVRLRALAGRHLGDGDTLQIVAQTARTQIGNRRVALDRLRQLVAAALVVPVARRPTRPSQGARRRRLEDKRHRSITKSRRNDLE